MVVFGQEQKGKANGLVDVLGSFDDAVKIAAKKAKLKEGDYRVKYPKAKNTLETVMAKFNKDGEDEKLREYLGTLAPYAKQLKSFQKMEKLQARMSIEFEIK